MSDYILGSDTVLDLEDIWEYIAADSIEAADRWIATLFDAFETVAGMPASGIAERISRRFRSCSGQWEPI